MGVKCFQILKLQCWTGWPVHFISWINSQFNIEFISRVSHQIARVCIRNFILEGEFICQNLQLTQQRRSLFQMSHVFLNELQATFFYLINVFCPPLQLRFQILQVIFLVFLLRDMTKITLILAPTHFTVSSFVFKPFIKVFFTIGLEFCFLFTRAFFNVDFTHFMQLQKRFVSGCCSGNSFNEDFLQLSFNYNWVFTFL